MCYQTVYLHTKRPNKELLHLRKEELERLRQTCRTSHERSTSPSSTQDTADNRSLRLINALVRDLIILRESFYDVLELDSIRSAVFYENVFGFAFV